jgi:hypothetical protein
MNRQCELMLLFSRILFVFSRLHIAKLGPVLRIML